MHSELGEVELARAAERAKDLASFHSKIARLKPTVSSRLRCVWESLGTGRGRLSFCLVAIPAGRVGAAKLTMRAHQSELQTGT